MDTITIKRQDFSKFLNTLKLFQDVCTDCDIVDGLVRQKTNDRYCTIEIDLTSVLGESSLTLGLLKTKMLLLKSFELDDSAPESDGENNIIVEFDKNDYRFIDDFSTLSFRIPIKKFLDNQYILDSDFSKMFTLKEEDLIFSTEINSYMCKRIKAITEGFDSEFIIWNMDKFEGSLVTETINKENTSNLVKDIELNTEMPSVSSKITSLPFKLDINSDIKINAYQVKKNVMICKFEMKYFGIPIIMYAGSNIIKSKK